MQWTTPADWFWDHVYDWLDLDSIRGYWDPYYAGGHPIRYDDPQYQFNQVMAGINPAYSALYRAGAQNAMASDYAKNRDWSGIVTYPGASDFGGYRSVGSAGHMIVSESIRRLYR